MELGNGGESEKNFNNIFCSKWLPNNLLKYFTRAMNHPV
jgi:hypothetical protein